MRTLLYVYAHPSIHMFIHTGVSVCTHICYVVRVLYSTHVCMYKYIPVYVCGVCMCMCDIYVCTQTYIERDGLTYKCLCVWNAAISLEVSRGEFLKLSWNGKAFLSWKLSIWRARLINLVTFIGFIFSDFFFFLKMHKEFNNGCLSREILAVLHGERFFFF